MERRIGIALGVLVGILLVWILLKLTKNNGKIKCEYDERQEIVRGRGFKYSYFTLLLYMALYALLTLSEVALPVDNYMIMLIGLILSVTVQVIYCTWNEAYISLNANPKKLLVAFTAVGLVNLAIGVLSLIRGNLIENGILTFRAANLLVGIMCFLICLFVVLKRKLADGAEEEE